MYVDDPGRAAGGDRDHGGDSTSRDRVSGDSRQQLLALSAPDESRWPQILPITLVCVLGLVLTIGLVVLQGLTARSSARAEVHRALDNTSSRASESLAMLNGSVSTLASWLSLDSEVSETRFTTLAERAVGQRNDLQSLEYAPVIRYGDRRDFEARLAARGHDGGITELGPDGLRPADRRDMYLPLEFVAPSGDTIVHGFDALARGNNREAILEAVGSGATAVAEPITLIEDGTLALLTFTPVFQDGVQPQTAAQRRRAWTGMVLGVVRVDEWIAAAASSVDPAGVELTLLDLGEQLLWSNIGESDTADGATDILWTGEPLLVLKGSAGRYLLDGTPAWRTGATAAVGLLLTLALALATWKWGEAQAVRKRAEALERRSRDLQVLAETDPLTGLLHRDGLRRWLREWLRNNPKRPIALMVIDLNNFKEVNAVAGHMAGDSVLEQVGRRLSILAADSDTTVGRMGGDQFVVMRAGDRGSMTGLVSVIQSMISEPLQAADVDVELTSSLGVAYSPDDGNDLDSLMLHADLAVHEAKKQPGNSATHFHPVLVAEGQHRRRQALALRMAAREPDEHFLLEYQPQVDMLTGRVVGAEALLRWRHDGTIHYPGSFLAMATQQGLMPTLGEWVLRRACTTLASWPDACRLVVAVNVEAQQIRRAFASTVRAIVDETGIDPSRLTLEVTEAAAMDPGARTQLDVLRRTGMGVAIDDFGTGFSSLSRLTEVPACELKIDRTFIAELGRRPEALDIVQAIHALATALDLSIVAEGVETSEQAQILIGEGVRVAQGFLYSPAVSDQQFLRLCERGFPAHAQ